MSPDLPGVGTWVDIHYRRPGKGTTVFRQQVLEAKPSHIVTFQPATALAKPVLVGGTPILENGSPAIWFTMPGVHHDIGIFHRADGSRTGLYANVLTPVYFESPGTWHTTDLFLDWWMPDRGEPRWVDRDELEAALQAGTVDARQARAAEAEASRLQAEWRGGLWPPTFVEEWTLDRALNYAFSDS
jgi:predicted RNA-binding protein associated with RNAse of E/G family